MTLDDKEGLIVLSQNDGREIVIPSPRPPLLEQLDVLDHPGPQRESPAHFVECVELRLFAILKTAVAWSAPEGLEPRQLPIRDYPLISALRIITAVTAHARGSEAIDFQKSIHEPLRKYGLAAFANARLGVLAEALKPPLKKAA